MLLLVAADGQLILCLQLANCLKVERIVFLIEGLVCRHLVQFVEDLFGLLERHVNAEIQVTHQECELAVLELSTLESFWECLLMNTL